MLQISEAVLASGYTIKITKDQSNDGSKFVGTYHKKMETGSKTYPLPEEELAVFANLPNINELLSTGGMLQIHQPGLCYFAIAGREKTADTLQDTTYLEEHATAERVSYCDCLADLDVKLALNKNQQDAKAPQYKKRYNNGGNRYE